MGFTTIYEPCNCGLPRAIDYRQGTIIRCDNCRQNYRRDGGFVPIWQQVGREMVGLTQFSAAIAKQAKGDK